MTGVAYTDKLASPVFSKIAGTRFGYVLIVIACYHYRFKGQINKWRIVEACCASWQRISIGIYRGNQQRSFDLYTILLHPSGYSRAGQTMSNENHIPGIMLQNFIIDYLDPISTNRGFPILLFNADKIKLIRPE